MAEREHKHYNDGEPDRCEDMELCKIDVDAFVDMFVEQDGNTNESVDNDENEVAIDNNIKVEVFAKE
ncbi:hypothetical protein VNO78_07237 [Psophocarpus tetragonolobus]|uniref:Uncharacterized protein n=1 Tax=Psophocarpus tetragonolobus TaxID=3891 RepID=A0AAN9SVX7_PSOTE